MHYNLPSNALSKACLMFLIILSQSSCVSKKQYQGALKRTDTISMQLNNEIKKTYILSLELLKLQGLYIEHLKHDSILANNSSNIIYLDKGLISFPNPPPQPSSRYTFNSQLFNQCKTYQDINEWIIKALSKAGYDNKINYFLFDNGFAIATDIEQINNDATTKPQNQRWFANRVNILSNDFTLKEYFKVLFTAQPGYYRSFVFIISPSIFSFSSNDYTKDLFAKYLSQGAIGLPNRLGNIKLPQDLKVTALIYEFKKPENSNEANLILDGISGYEHLKRSSIISNTTHGN
ncbi:MAG: hypothetical protein JWQ79_1934 [Mucilaginibacter sp.]|nr:hypothetical protein [Mucilaginibacter sp.]